MFNSLHLINLLLDVVESYINDFFVNFYIYIIFCWFLDCSLLVSQEIYTI